MGNRLKEARTALHLSREYAARQTGTDGQRMEALESGTAVPTYDEAVKLSVLYGVPADVLLHGDREAEKKTAGINNLVLHLSDHDKEEVRSLYLRGCRLRAKTD